MKMTKTQIDYLKSRLYTIVQEKMAEVEKGNTLRYYEWLEANPPALRKFEDVPSHVFSIGSFFDDKAFNAFQATIAEENSARRKELNDIKQRILDAAVLGKEDITNLIKELEEA